MTSFRLTACVSFGLFPFVLGGCSPSDGATLREPRHLHVICAASRSDADCPRDRRIAAFINWAKEAVNRPGSSFRIEVVGQRRQEKQVAFVACTPDDGWGGDVMAHKAAFIAEGRRRAGMALGSEDPESLVQGCDPDARHAPQADQILLLGLDSDTGSSIAQMVAAAEQVDPLHFIIICDISESGFEDACTGPKLQQMYDAWLGQRDIASEASVSVHLVRSAGKAPLQVFRMAIPDHLCAGERMLYALGARREIATVVPTQHAPVSSAIAEAFYEAMNQPRQRGRYVVVFLSDMREVNGRFNFEKQVPKVTDFARWLEASRLVVDARGVSVVACGLHDQGGTAGAYNPELGIEVRHLWEAILKAEGAKDVRLFPACDREALAFLKAGDPHRL